MMLSKKTNYLLFLLAACFWGGSFVGIKIAVAAWPPIFAAMVRLIVAVVSLFIIFKIAGKSTYVPYRERWRIWIVGLFTLTIPFSFLFWGERFISAGMAGILNSTTPIWTFILSLIFLPNHTTASVQKIIGLIVGMLGVIIIFLPMLSFKGERSEILGIFAVLGMAVSYAIGALLTRYLLTGAVKIDFAANLYHQHWAGFAALLLLTIVFREWPAVSTFSNVNVWLACIYLGLFSTAIGWMIYFHLIREWDAVRVSTVSYLIPATTFLWDFLFFRHYPTSNELFGVGIILIGVTLIQFPNLKLVLLKKQKD